MEVEIVVVVGVAGEETPVATLSLLVEVLSAVAAVLSLSTSVGKGTAEVAAEEGLLLCKRREDIGRPIEINILNKMAAYISIYNT